MSTFYNFNVKRLTKMSTFKNFCTIKWSTFTIKGEGLMTNIVCYVNYKVRVSNLALIR